jgi:hypothetical protein
MWPRWQARLQSTARLNAGLLVGAEHVLVGPQRLALPAAGVQVQHRAGQLEEVRVARKDPALMAPRAQRVVHQPAPDAAARRTGLGAQEGGHFCGEFAHAVAAEWNVTLGWSFTRQRDHQGACRGRQDARPAAAWSVLESIAPVRLETSAPALHRRPTHAFLVRQPTRPESGGTAQNDARAARQALWSGRCTRPTGQRPLLDCGQHDRRCGSSHLATPHADATRPAGPPGSPAAHDCAVSDAIGTLAACLCHVGVLTFPGYRRSCPHCRPCSTRARPRAA